MVLLRRVIGDALRARRQAQHRTLREVSTAANVSLGYLSEIERGQKEASSELLAAICDALGARMSELLHEVSFTVASAEQVDGILAPVAAEPAVSTLIDGESNVSTLIDGESNVSTLIDGESNVSTLIDGEVSVTVRQNTPLKATLRATHAVRPTGRGRDVLSAA